MGITVTESSIKKIDLGSFSIEHRFVDGRYSCTYLVTNYNDSGFKPIRLGSNILEVQAVIEALKVGIILD
ncbi:hypothetical protein PSYJYH_000001 [Bacillus phage PSYJ-YH]|nr:hypothetical protein PSYJYH_000001 [Bacillus phage PSYJ-YH]